MDAHERRRGVDVAEHQRDAAFDAADGRRVAGAAGLGLRNDAFKAVEAEMSPTGGEVGLRYLADRYRGHA
jgi:hypothetical protein